jgi:hypothetical protein
MGESPLLVLQVGMEKEDREQESEVRSQESGVRIKRKEIRNCLPTAEGSPLKLLPEGYVSAPTGRFYPLLRTADSEILRRKPEQTVEKGFFKVPHRGSFRGLPFGSW